MKWLSLSWCLEETGRHKETQPEKTDRHHPGTATWGKAGRAGQGLEGSSFFWILRELNSEKEFLEGERGGLVGLGITQSKLQWGQHESLESSKDREQRDEVQISHCLDPPSHAFMGSVDL